MLWKKFKNLKRYNDKKKNIEKYNFFQKKKNVVL